MLDQERRVSQHPVFGVVVLDELTLLSRLDAGDAGALDGDEFSEKT